MASSLDRRYGTVGDPRRVGGRQFFLDWRDPTEKADAAVARLRERGIVEPDDLIVSAVWYGDPRPDSRWVTQKDLSSAEKDRLLVVAQQALGADWIDHPAPPGDDEGWSIEDLTDDELLRLRG